MNLSRPAYLLILIFFYSACSPEPAPAPSPDEQRWAHHRQLALAAYERGQLDTVAQHLDSALTRAASFADDDPRRLESLDRRAHLYQLQGYPGKAADLYADILARQSLPADHPQTLAILEKIAAARRDQGQTSQAAELYQQILATLLKDPQRENPQLAAAMEKQAQTLRQLDRLEEAAALSQRATGLKYYFQARALYLKEDLDQAEQFYRRALNIQDKVTNRAAVASQRQDLAATYGGLALLYEYRGQYRRAAELYDKAVGVLGAALAADHPTLEALVRNRDEARQKAAP